MNENLEKRFEMLADNRIVHKKYKVFDKASRVIKRQRFPELVEKGQTENNLCLVILNAAGEAIVLTEEFEKELFRIAKIRFG